MSIYEKLGKVQQLLIAPKNKKSNHIGYKYRTCEGILEALKKPLAEVNASVTISDKILPFEGRFYIEATATFIDNESNEQISVTGLAREAQNKKGMEEAQMTGATSSYARKYALCGLFAIDGSDDIDSLPPDDHDEKSTKNTSGQTTKEPTKQQNVKAPDNWTLTLTKELNYYVGLGFEKNAVAEIMKQIASMYGVETARDINEKQRQDYLKRLKEELGTQ